MAKSRNKAQEAAAEQTPGQNGDVQTIHAEEIHGDPGPSLPIAQELTAEQQATREVARFDIARTWIAAKKAEYDGLTIAGIDDKEGEKAVKTAWQEVRNKRLAVANKHKEIKADYLVITRAVDKEKNELTELLEEVEKPLKAELDRIEQERENIKLQKEREAQEKLQGRVSELLDNGMKFNGSYYSIGDTISMDVVTLKEFSDDLYNQFLDRVKAENDRIKQAENDRLEQERKDREEQERLREENERKEQELADERKRMADERLAIRVEFLESLGFVRNDRLKEWQYRLEDVDGVLPDAGLGELSADDWNKVKEQARDIVRQATDRQAKVDQERKAEKEAEAHRKARLDKLADMGIYLVGTQLQYTIAVGSVYHIADVSLLDNQDAGEFDAWVETVKAEIKRRTDDYQEAAKLETERRERSAVHHNDMEHLGFYLTGNVYVMRSSWDETMAHTVNLDDVEKATADEWKGILGGAIKFTKELEAFDAEKKRLDDEAKEAARVSALSDVEKAREWLKRIAAVMAEKPTVTSQPVDYAITNFDAGVENEVSEFIATLDNIETEA